MTDLDEVVPQLLTSSTAIASRRKTGEARHRSARAPHRGARSEGTDSEAARSQIE